MSNVIDTQGTLLKRGDGTDPTETFTDIPRVQQIDTIGIGRALRQITDLSHTAAHQHKLGLPDVPEISVECLYDPDDAQHQGIFSDHANGVTRNFQIHLADATPTVVAFSALVLEPNIGAPDVDGDVPLRFSLKPQSVPTGLFS